MRTATWTPDGGGDPITLSDDDNGYIVLYGDLSGLNMPVYQHTTDVIPGVPGERLRDTRATARPMSLPMHVHAETRSDYRLRAKRLCGAFAPDGGRQGWLEIAEADGQQRRIRAIYNAGLEGAEGGATGGNTDWWTFVISLTALDPFWYSDAVEVTIDYAEPVPFFPKLQLSSSQVLGEVPIYNPGDVPAWPTWTITGPGTDPTLIAPNGDTLALSGSILEGETLTIVTKPGEQDIHVDGVNWWDHITDDIVMWQLPVGQSSSTLQLTGATATSSITVSFDPAYWTPL